MNVFMAVILPFCIYWLILFAACYIIVEYGQTYLYDEATPAVGLKVALGSFILAVLLTIFRTSYESMFTEGFHWSLLQGIAWFLVFMFLFRFHPVHAFSIGVVAFVILAGASTLAANSFSGNHPAGVAASREQSKPLRRTMAPAAPAAPSTKPAAGAKN